MREERDFGTVYREYASFVCRYLIRLGCPAQDAEDITQDTFVKALLHMDAYRGECKLSVWLCQIAKNTWLTQQKKRKREMPHPLHEEATCDDHICEWMDLVESLREPYRTVFSEKVFGDRSYAEIARTYQKSESWARVTFYRARTCIQQMLKDRRT